MGFRKKFFQVFFYVLFAAVLISTIKFHIIPEFVAYQKNKSQKKQIILISIDTLRADHLPVYGYERNTAPNLTSLVDMATLYTNSYTNSPWTYPSHMTLLTGALPSRHGVNESFKSYIVDEKLPVLNSSVQNIAEILKQYGFNTVKIANLPDEIGFSQGFDTNYNIDPIDNVEDFSIAMSELENNADNDFFLFIHTWKVHAPYSNTRFLSKKKKDKIGKEMLDQINNHISFNGYLSFSDFNQLLERCGLLNINDCVDLYDGGIYFTDQYIGKIIEKCKELGIYDDVLLAIVSDHGEHFGERDKSKFYDEHGWDYYEEFIKVPFIIKYPNQSAKKINHTYCSLINFVPTALNFYGMEIPEYIQGDSMIGGAQKDYFISEATSLHGIEKKMIMKDQFKYIVTMDQPENPGRANWNAIVEEKLIDLRRDPYEEFYFKKDSYTQGLYRQLHEQLKHEITRSSENFSSIHQTILNSETIENLKSLGYIK